MGYICEARREAGVELWRDSEPDGGCVPDGLLVTFGRADAGTELRSGAIVASFSVLLSVLLDSSALWRRPCCYELRARFAASGCVSSGRGSSGSGDPVRKAQSAG